MPALDSMTLDDLELRTVALASPLNRTMVKDAAYTEEIVETSKGAVTVAWAGDRRKTAIITYHDLGLNYISNFQAFFNYPEMREICANFCVFHVNAPGQEESAHPLPDTMEYPSMDDMAEQVNDVLNHFALVKYVGLGVGMGGNVLLRHALQYPERVDSLALINTLCTATGWIEWGYQKRNIGHLRQHGVSQPCMDYLLWHHFGYYPEERAHDLVSMYRHYFSQDIEPSNLAKLTEQYIWRTAVDIDRENNMEMKGDTKTLKVPILNLVGSQSPFVDETVTLNGKLNPVNATWMKIQDSSMVLEERPGKVAEAFRLFLQGQGYCLQIRKKTAVVEAY